MSNLLYDFLREADVDIDGALNRFSSNDALYTKFLLRFSTDESMSNIRRAFESSNWEEALSAAHSLKGLAGNLGFIKLQNTADSIMTLFKEGEYEQARQLFEVLQEDYNHIVVIIMTYA